MNDSLTKAYERNDSALRQVKFMEELFETCDKWCSDIETIAPNSHPNHWEYIADEIQELKTALYEFGRAAVEARIKNSEYAGQQRRIILSTPESEPKDSRDNNDWLNGITQQIQDTMATLTTGDHAVIVIRKDSSEETEDNTTEEIRDICSKHFGR